MHALAALLPSVGVGLLFWLAIRAMVNGDRREREELARMEREERERKAAKKDSPVAPATAPDDEEERRDRA